MCILRKFQNFGVPSGYLYLQKEFLPSRKHPTLHLPKTYLGLGLGKQRVFLKNEVGPQHGGRRSGSHSRLRKPGPPMGERWVGDAAVIPEPVLPVGVQAPESENDVGQDCMQEPAWRLGLATPALVCTGFHLVQARSSTLRESWRWGGGDDVKSRASVAGFTQPTPSSTEMHSFVSGLKRISAQSQGPRHLWHH